MARTLAKIQEQIAALQKKADAARAKEVGDVVRKIQEAIKFYDLTAEDLFSSSPVGKKRAKRVKSETAGSSKAVARKPATRKSSSKGAGVPVKYRDGNGNTWTGRGNKPRWLSAAIAGGATVDQFLIS